MGEKKRRQAASTSGATSPAADRARHWVDLGLAAHREGRAADAIGAYQQALRLTPGHADALAYQGLALYQLGQPQAGIALMREACTHSPGHRGHAFNLAQALAGSGAPVEALDEYRRLIALAPDDTAVLSAAAELAQAQGMDEQALAWLEAAHAAAPADTGLLAQLAEQQYRGNRLEAAVASWNEAVRRQPSLRERSNFGFARPAASTPSTRLRFGEAPSPGLGSQAEIDGFHQARDLHVIDDLLADPLAYRDRALALDFDASRYAGQNYPGLQTVGQPCQAIMERIASALGQPIKWRSPDNGAFRVSLADSVARTDIHVDNERGSAFNQFAAVLYLSLPEHCHGGTTFWRHQQTGWEQRPTQQQVSAAGYASFQSFQHRWLPREQVTEFNRLKDRRDGWQPLLEVPMRFNRLVFYRHHFFHSISDVFGTSPENGRLVQLFSFELLA